MRRYRICVYFSSVRAKSATLLPGHWSSAGLVDRLSGHPICNWERAQFKRALPVGSGDKDVACGSEELFYDRPAEPLIP